MNESEPKQVELTEWEMSCSYCGRYAKHRASTLDCIELKGRTKFENSNKHKLPKLVEFFSESEDKWEPHPVIWLMDTDTSFCTVWVTKENVLDQNNVIRALAIVMIIITGILLLVWCREHRLINQCISDLKKDKVRFPEEDKWMGVTGCTWRIVHWGSLVIWFLTIFFPECIFNFLRS